MTFRVPSGPGPGAGPSPSSSPQPRPLQHRLNASSLTLTTQYSLLQQCAPSQTHSSPSRIRQSKVANVATGPWPEAIGVTTPGERAMCGEGEGIGKKAEADAGGKLPGTRRPSSKLKLELLSYPVALQMLSVEPPQPMTPSRIHVTASDGGASSPIIAGTMSLESPDSYSSIPLPVRRQRYAKATGCPPGVAPASASPPASLAASSSSLPPSSAAKRRGRSTNPRPRPWVFETPPAAPHYPHIVSPVGGNDGSEASRGANSIHADFNPWRGTHIEDAFTEGIIKNGFFDRSQAAYGEILPARAGLPAVLKQKSGVSQLSRLLVATMNRRRQRGQILTPSTFKPPPRVTLTDTKREIWLKDLANPLTSLRKLSRTIPHGIRSGLLLEHCLNKKVPINRAVWLSKCVGANELRSFHRKKAVTSAHVGAVPAPAMLGELKYIRDWTVSVEQFIDKLAAGVGGGSDWKGRILYAIRLATNLYSQQLLERDHYLDWVVTGLESSALARLPLWLLLIELVWDDLVRLRRFASRLAYALSTHALTFRNDSDVGSVLPLSSKLCSLLSCLVRNNPEAFISPGLWRAIKAPLCDLLSGEDETIVHILRTIESRNESLGLSARPRSVAWREELLALLDTSLQDIMPPEMAGRCWATDADVSAVAALVIGWCTSPHRSGAVRLYVGEIILRLGCRTRSFDLTASILSHIEDRDDNGGFGGLGSEVRQDQDRLFFKLVSDLVLTGHFSVPRYMQWLVVRGGVRAAADIAFNGPWATRLLVELPVCALRSSLAQWRASILRPVGFDSSLEGTDVTAAVSLAEKVIRLPLPESSPSQTWAALGGWGPSVAGAGLAPDSSSKRRISLDRFCHRLRLSSRALQTYVARWIGSTVSAWARNRHSSFPTYSFCTIRSILEAIVDYPVLAEVMMALAPSADVVLLTCCADTVCFYADVFSALGALNQLFDAIRGRLLGIVREKGIDPEQRTTLSALVSLADRTPSLSEAAVQLQLQISELDHSSFCVRSPASDHLSEVHRYRYLHHQDINRDHEQQQQQQQHPPHLLIDPYYDYDHPHGPKLSPPDSEFDPVYDEIERLLVSGPSSDSAAMDRMFFTMISRFEASWAGKDASDSKRPCAQLLARLRALDQIRFDLHMAAWVSDLRMVSARRHLREALPLLIEQGCVSIATVLDSASLLTAATASKQPSLPSSPWPLCSLYGPATYCQEILQVMVGALGAASGLLIEERFRFYASRRWARDQHSVRLLHLVRHAISEYGMLLSAWPRSSPALPLDDPECRAGMFELLRFLIPRDVRVATHVLGEDGPSKDYRSLMSLVASRLLIPEPVAGPLVGRDTAWQLSAAIPFERLIRLTNELTRPFCQLKLHLDFARARSLGTSPAVEGPQFRSLLDELSDVIYRAVDGSAPPGWASMLAHAGEDVLQHLKSRVEARILDIIPSVSSFETGPSAKGSERDSNIGGKSRGLEEANRATADGLMVVLESITSAQSQYHHHPPQQPSSPRWQTSSMAPVTAKLASLLKILSTHGTGDRALRVEALEHWLPLTLRLLPLYQPTHNAHPMPASLDNDNGNGKVDAAGPPTPSHSASAPAPAVAQAHLAAASNAAASTTMPPRSSGVSPLLGDLRVHTLLVLLGLLQQLEIVGNVTEARLNTSLVEHVFDTALSLVDGMSEDLRTTCVQHLRLRLRGPSSPSATSPSSRRLLCYVLSHMPVSSPNHLNLVTRDRTVRPPAGKRRATATSAAKRGGRGAAAPAKARSGGIETTPKPSRPARFIPRRWEILNEPTPHIGENDTTLSLTLFDAIKLPSRSF